MDKLIQESQIKAFKSNLGAPIILVKKKDGSLCFCIDYRWLNTIMKNDAYPLPLIDEYLNTHNSCQYFTAMELASGYWQVDMDPTDQEKTAFSNHKGLLE